MFMREVVLRFVGIFGNIGTRNRNSGERVNNTNFIAIKRGPRLKCAGGLLLID